MRTLFITLLLLYSILLVGQTKHRSIPLIYSGKTRIIEKDTFHVIIPDTILSNKIRYHTVCAHCVLDWDSSYRYALSGKNLKDGKYLWYYDSAETMPKWKFFIKNGEYEGLFIEYSEYGNIEETSYYIGGKLNGLDIKYERNGMVYSIIEYTNNKRKGMEISMFENSTLAQLEYCKNDTTCEVIENWGLDGHDKPVPLIQRTIKIIKDNSDKK